MDTDPNRPDLTIVKEEYLDFSIVKNDEQDSSLEETREQTRVLPIGKRRPSVKRKLTNQPLEKKYQAIMAVEEGKLSKKKISQEYGIPQNTLSSWLKRAQDIKESYLNGDFGPQRKRSRRSKFPEVEDAVLKWYRNAEQQNMHVTGPAIMEKADSFARALGVPESEFCGSSGWLDRFKSRHSIKFSQKNEVSNFMESKSDKWKCKLQSILKEYRPENIFNADETGLFYRALQDNISRLKSVDFRRSNLSAERFTVLVCTNMTGTEKLKLLVIGKFWKPRSFKNVKKLPTAYKANKNAWMVSKFFTEWVTALDNKMNSDNRRVVLIVGSCAGHTNVQGLKAVKLVFIPSSLPKETHPLNQGVIKSLKLHYRTLILQRQSQCKQENREFVLTQLDALRLVQQAWANISQTTITDCFRRANFVPKKNLVKTEKEEDLVLVEERYGKEDISEYASIDDNVPTSEPVTDELIIAEIISARNGKDSDDEDMDHQLAQQPPCVQPPTLQQTLESIDTLRALVETQENAPDKFFQYLDEIGNYVSKIQWKENSTNQNEKYATNQGGRDSTEQSENNSVSENNSTEQSENKFTYLGELTDSIKQEKLGYC